MGDRANISFYALSVLYWGALIISKISFEALFIYDVYQFGLEFRLFLLSSIFMLYLFIGSKRAKSVVFLICLHNFVDFLCPILFGNLGGMISLIKTSFFIGMFSWIVLRVEYKTPRGINRDNILLAFYKGNKGSFIMHLFETFGLPFKSMCIMAGGYSLKLKATKDTFSFTKSADFIASNKDDYYIYDTGVPYTEKFITEMRKYGNVNARKNGMRIRCIEAVSDLLGLIGEEYRPRSVLHNVPSIYFKRVWKL